jgi:hypothetical protein
MKGRSSGRFAAGLAVVLCLAGCGREQGTTGGAELNDARIDEIVRHSYPYVALYNVINKFALDPEFPGSTGGWNRCLADTQLKDHTMRAIARPNNDTLYIGCMLDLRKHAVVLDVPAFDSKYASLMAVAYDHYVNVPLTTRLGDFAVPERVLFYSARTEGYDGEPVEGVNRSFEMTGDFVVALFRVMPHRSEPERFRRILDQMRSVQARTLAQLRGDADPPSDAVKLPPFGRSDADVFAENLLEVMQFVFNHTTFDPDDVLDQSVLAVYRPLGIEPGMTWDPARVARIDGGRFRRAAQRIQAENLALVSDTIAFSVLAPRLLRRKGEMDLDAMLAQSIIGPIGLPMEEATYPNVASADGSPLNASNDYVIRMTKDELPPANGFWSLTLYDLANGFFIPNDRKKYSVGENAGMLLGADGGIEIYVAASKPEGVPEENWLPIPRRDENMDIILRIYLPDLARLRTWAPPRAQKLD